MPHTPTHLPNLFGENKSKSSSNGTSKKGAFDLTEAIYGINLDQNSPDRLLSQSEPHQVLRNSVPVARLQFLRDEWIAASSRAQQSARTIGEKRNYSDKLIWFVHAQNYENVGIAEIEAFFDHLTFGHLLPNGRFDRAAVDQRAKNAMRPISVKSYFLYLKGWFSYLVRRGELHVSPFDQMDAPKANPDQVQPFTIDQIQALIRVAKNSMCPARNVAILLFLLDTGARASECVSLTLGDVDFSDEQTLRVRVLGKGNKRRTLRLSPTSSAAMWRYFKTEHGLERFYKNRTSGRRRKIDTNTPLFISAHRAYVGQALTRDGLRLVITDLGTAAGIGAVRCSPHTFRHTFAINFLRSGGDIFTLRDMLGHSSLSMVQRYLALAQSDMEAQHAKYSPVERMIGYR